MPPHFRPTTAISSRVALLIAISLVAGCAPKPWHDLVSDDGRTAMLDVLDEIIEAQISRPRCFDADVKVFLTSWVKNRAADGYAQVMAPDTVKFVTSNPFGQPVFAFVGNRQQFQYVNTINRIYLDGDINEFANIYEFPLEDFSGPWGDWLSGRIPADNARIVEMRADSSDKGVWVSYAPQAEAEKIVPANEHLLIDPEHKQLLARTIADNKGKIIARIDYYNRSAPPLSQPQKLKVTRLAYGAELEVQFSNLMAMESCENQDFFIKRPAGYIYQHLTRAHY